MPHHRDLVIKHCKGKAKGRLPRATLCWSVNESNPQAAAIAPSLAASPAGRLLFPGCASDLAAARMAHARTLGPGLCRVFQFLRGGPGFRQCQGDFAGCPYPGGNDAERPADLVRRV